MVKTFLNNILDSMLIIGFCVIIIFLTRFCIYKTVNSQAETDNSEKTELPLDLADTDEAEDEAAKRRLEQLIYDVQKAYIRKDYLGGTSAADFTFSDGNKRVSLREEDLEELTFYVHEKDEVWIYFVPTKQELNSLLNHSSIMFRFHMEEIIPCRDIQPCPVTTHYSVHAWDVTEIRDELKELGTVRSAFPSEETIGSESWQIEKKLKENEYTQAVADMICGTLKGGGLYGEYEIYIDTYCMTDQTAYLKKCMGFEGNGINGIVIGASVVCRENGYGQHCDFIASDQLKDGKVEIYYWAPAAPNQWKEVVNSAINEHLLMIPVTVSAEDEIEIQENPYGLVLLPVLDNAQGIGIFPEDADMGEDMVFWNGTMYYTFEKE